MEIIIQDKLSQIAQRLILETSSLTNPGLYNGKMGIAIFFAHYAKKMNDSLYQQYVYYLIEELAADLYDGYSYNMEFGLSGIGWGIEYLIQNDLIDADSDEILSDIDTSIMSWDLFRINDLSLEKGLPGIFTYVFTRLNTQKREKGRKMPFDEVYLKNILQVGYHNGALLQDEYSYNLYTQLKDLIEKKEYSLNKPLLSDSIRRNFCCSTDINQKSLALNNGLAGLGLKLLEI